MIVIPAIDLKNGQCVRLFQGEMDQATVYSSNPGEMARHWQSLGAERLHVVDLNGAFAGHPVNGAALDAILAALSIPVQMGGGLRSMADIEACLARGVQIAILGTVACRQPQLVQQACRAFPGRISVGMDVRNDSQTRSDDLSTCYVAVQGWSEKTAIQALELAKQFEQSGVAEIIFTDIHRDGALTGPNIPLTRALAEQITIPVIASGGVSALSDIQSLLTESGPYANGNRISAVITGKAIYDGRLDFRQAMACAKDLPKKG